jgi:hypothetical protein
MLPLLMWLCTSVIGFVRIGPQGRVIRGVCAACRYSLGGLASEGICPECGTPFASNGQAQVVQGGLSVTLFRPGLLMLTLVVLCVAATWPVWGNCGIVNWIEAEIMMRRGFRPDVAWNEARWSAWGRPVRGCCASGPEPAACLAALLPLVGRLPGRWAWAAIAGAGLLMLGAAVSIWLEDWVFE